MYTKIEQESLIEKLIDRHLLDADFSGEPYNVYSLYLDITHDPIYESLFEKKLIEIDPKDVLLMCQSHFDELKYKNSYNWNSPHF